LDGGGGDLKARLLATTVIQERHVKYVTLKAFSILKDV
jgi:hypothetical protein